MPYLNDYAKSLVHLYEEKKVRKPVKVSERLKIHPLTDYDLCPVLLVFMSNVTCNFYSFIFLAKLLRNVTNSFI